MPSCCCCRKISWYLSNSFSSPFSRFNGTLVCQCMGRSCTEHGWSPRPACYVSTVFWLCCCCLELFKYCYILLSVCWVATPSFQFRELVNICFTGNWMLPLTLYLQMKRLFVYSTLHSHFLLAYLQLSIWSGGTQIVISENLRSSWRSGLRQLLIAVVPIFPEDAPDASLLCLRWLFHWIQHLLSEALLSEGRELRFLGAESQYGYLASFPSVQL